MLNHLVRPAYSSNSQDVLSRIYDVAPHPALEAATDVNGLPMPVDSSGAGGFPLAIGTGAYLPLPLGDLHSGNLAAPDRPICTFFLRTGTCAYGDRCKFQHPQDRPPPVLNSRGYPLRSDEVDCAHYLKKGWCAFNLTCKFNHPELPPPVLPGSPYSAQAYGNLPSTAGAYGGRGGLYPGGPAQVPLMYYVPSPIGSGLLPNNGFNGGNNYQANAAALQAAYGGGNAHMNNLNASANLMYRQQQQLPQHMSPSTLAAAQHQAVQQHQAAQQHQAMYSGMPDPMMAGGGGNSCADQLTSVMQKLQLGRLIVAR